MCVDNRGSPWDIPAVCEMSSARQTPVEIKTTSFALATTRHTLAQGMQGYSLPLVLKVVSPGSVTWQTLSDLNTMHFPRHPRAIPHR
ncbi:hypothetical protein Hypma_003281 [Hypsizygus marmoreus]|uniref:Uncharacterized protein n=1 Tax=Hypsizygus marmoreus TaxID=39966 RepID=A0A369K9X1_HYPMA|nr:hypothetical protein Hypma_003281 [Hypsizygus marmoreus]